MTKRQRAQFRSGWKKGMEAASIRIPEPLGTFSDWLVQAPIMEARGFARGYKYGLHKAPLTREQVFLLRTRAPANLRLFVY